ncbi:unnamed protein product, partial [Callosobruchus maculatus]
ETSGFEPDFLYPLENVTVAQGRDATFTCVVNNLGGYRVPSTLRLYYGLFDNCEPCFTFKRMRSSATQVDMLLYSEYIWS